MSVRLSKIDRATLTSKYMADYLSPFSQLVPLQYSLPSAPDAMRARCRAVEIGLCGQESRC